MTSISIILDGDRKDYWPDLKALPDGKLLEVEINGAALLPDGEVTTPSGETKRVPLIVARVGLPDGSVGLAQIKLEMWESVARAMRGRLQYLADQRAAAKGDA